MSKRLIPFLLLLSSSYSFSQNVNDSVLNLFFDVNKYQLNKQQLVQLDELVSKNVSFTCIKGFADSTGSIAYNKELSRKRANAVYIYLKKSLHDSEIKPGHYGEQQATGEDISYNRRVEICYKKEVLQESLLQEKTPIEEKPIVNEQKIIDSPTTKYELSNIYFVPDKAIIEACSFYAVDEGTAIRARRLTTTKSLSRRRERPATLADVSSEAESLSRRREQTAPQGGRTAAK